MLIKEENTDAPRYWFFHEKNPPMTDGLHSQRESDTESGSMP